MPVAALGPTVPAGATFTRTLAGRSRIAWRNPEPLPAATSAKAPLKPNKQRRLAAAAAVDQEFPCCVGRFFFFIFFAFFAGCAVALV